MFVEAGEEDTLDCASEKELEGGMLDDVGVDIEGDLSDLQGEVGWSRGLWWQGMWPCDWLVVQYQVVSYHTPGHSASSPSPSPHIIIQCMHIFPQSTNVAIPGSNEVGPKVRIYVPHLCHRQFLAPT